MDVYAKLLAVQCKLKVCGLYQVWTEDFVWVA